MLINIIELKKIRGESKNVKIIQEKTSALPNDVAHAFIGCM
jgi:translation initiation factor 6 (eIF-6)